MRRITTVALFEVVAVFIGIQLVPVERANALQQDAQIAFVGATLIPMDRERILPNQTVLVRNGRIIAVGPADSVTVPPGARIIEADGRYLAPGLTDMHVHIMHDWGATTEFRDAPLYLANGVTTVLNLAGDSLHLVWRDQVNAGTLLGPTIYTSGRFVNEPTVNTPDEVEREVRAQAAAGFDVIKFREVVDSTFRPLTTHGLSRDAYRRMNETARELSIPLTGHAPNNLGLDAVLEDRQSLAHIGYTLLATYFWPRETAQFQNQQRLGTWILGALGAIAVLGWGVAIGAALRRRGGVARLLAPVAVITTLALAIAWFGTRQLWDTDRVGQAGRILSVTVAGVALALVALALGWQAFRVWRHSASAATRLYALTAALVSAALAATAVLYWVPLVRRSSDAGLRTLGREIAKSGISVITTIQVYRSSEVANNPEVRYVKVPPRWEPFRNPPPLRRAWSQNLVSFLERVAGALHREGVPLLAGTDVSWAFVIAGFSLHDELALIAAGGLSAFEVLRTATVEPARFLGKSEEFGTIAVGRRADLVLVEKNPLEDLSTLRKPLGVTARGRWLPASELDAMLSALATDAR